MPYICIRIWYLTFSFWLTSLCIIRSDQISHSVVSDSLRPHESQHTKPPYPSPTPGDHSDSRPSSQWCHPAISSSVVPFSSCPQSLPASESFPMSQLFAWGGQSTGVSALASFLPKKSQGWSPSEWTGPVGIYPEETKIEKDTCIPLFLAALFRIARTWKQPTCSLTDEWIKKVWYIYTMEYHSAIKRNTFESVLMRWMNLEPIIQSEVSQKEKVKYHILMHIYGI